VELTASTPPIQKLFASSRSFTIGAIIFFVVAKETCEVEFDAHRPLLTIAAPPLGLGRGGGARWCVHVRCLTARMLATRE